MDFSVPTQAQTVPGRIPRPRAATASFWLYVAMGVAALVDTVVSVVLLSQTSGSEMSAPIPGTSLHGSDLLPIVVGAVVVFGVLRIATLLAFTVVLRSGRGWARWVLAALVLLTLPDLTDQYGAGVPLALIGVAAAVFSFLRPVSAWLRSARDARSASRWQPGTPGSAT